MDFSKALSLLKNNQAIRRSSWAEFESIEVRKGNIDYSRNKKEKISGVNSDFFDIGDLFTVTRMPEIIKTNSDGSNEVWTHSNSDILAEDWESLN